MRRETQQIQKAPDKTEKQLEDTKVAVSIASSDLIETGSKVRDLKNQLVQLATDIAKNKKDAHEELAVFVAQSESKKKLLTDEIASLIALKNDALKRVNDINQSIDSKKDIDDAIIANNELLKSETEKLTQERYSVSLEIESKKEELLDVQKNIDTATSTVISLNKKISDLTQAIDDLESKISRKNDTITSINISISDFQKTKDTLQNEINDLIIQGQNLKSVNENFELEYQTKKDDLEEREKNAIERERSSTLLLETLDRKIAQVKTSSDVSVLKEFLSEVMNKK